MTAVRRSVRETIAGWRSVRWVCALAWLGLGCAHAPAREDVRTEGDVRPETALPRRVRRLSNAELERAVDQVLGIASGVTETLPADVRQDGYTINAEASVSPMMATRWARMAPDLVRLSLERGWLREAQAAPDFVTQALTRAFRRPPSSAELHAWTSLYATGDAESLLSTLLQAPGMLYLEELGRPEVGDASASHRLTDFEIASALSFAVWGGPPDEALLAAAMRGELQRGEVRSQHARRLLGRNEARHHLRQFVLEWLEVDGLLQTSKHAEIVPDYDRYKEAMVAETEAFVDEVMVHAGGSMRTLLAGRFTSIGPMMAAYYGLPASATGPRMGLAAHGRVGILQHASFLATHAHPDSPSPVKRGDFVLRRLLCVELPRPSELDLEVVIPAATSELTTRARFEAHRADPACSRCHRRIDPLGYLFESFDAGGRRRANEHGHPIVTASTVWHRGRPTDLADSADLSVWLSESPDVHTCMARQWFRYLSGQRNRAVERDFEALLGTLDPIARESFLGILVAYVASEMFVLRRSVDAEAVG